MNNPTEVSKIATALIDIHNALPQASADVMAAMPEDADEYEYLMEQYSNLLVTLWDIMHRLDGVDLEALHFGSGEVEMRPVAPVRPVFQQVGWWEGELWLEDGDVPARARITARSVWPGG